MEVLLLTPGFSSAAILYSSCYVQILLSLLRLTPKREEISISLRPTQHNKEYTTLYDLWNIIAKYAFATHVLNVLEYLVQNSLHEKSLVRHF